MISLYDPKIDHKYWTSLGLAVSQVSFFQFLAILIFVDSFFTIFDMFGHISMHFDAINDQLDHEFSYGTYLELKISIRALI